mgnify:CR=1 FL=1
MIIHFLNKIWQEKIDNSVHTQFVRFSRGKFENRAIINVRKQKNKVVLNSTFELANDLVMFVSTLDKEFNVSGVILTKQNPLNLFKEIEINAEIINKKNLFHSKLEKIELSSEQISKIANIAYYMLVDIICKKAILKIKKKLPQPSKSGKEKIDDKFCTLEISDSLFPLIHKEFLFGLPKDFKKARIVHTYEISEILLPKDEKDFEQMRLKAIRVGKIIRNINVDGHIMREEKNFKA